MSNFRPGVTVAAVVERAGKFLFVREQTDQGIRLNQPAGHLDPAESLLDAVVRETREETGWRVEPVSVVGIYLSRYQWAATDTDVTYLRFGIHCRALRADPDLPLDDGILEAVWLTPAEVAGCTAEHRSPQVAQTLNDYLAGQQYPLDILHTDAACLLPRLD
jgi:8-oxo-dGTP pyrophosphatase MutT (NUDIX family)